MSAFREAVAEANRRLKDDGCRSWSAPPEYCCVKCHQPNCVNLTTIFGTTRAFCWICSHDWEIDVR